MAFSAQSTHTNGYATTRNKLSISFSISEAWKIFSSTYYRQGNNALQNILNFRIIISNIFGAIGLL